jgi:hypothetical protein
MSTISFEVVKAQIYQNGRGEGSREHGNMET